MTLVPLKRLLSSSEVRCGSRGDAESLLSVSIHRGVVPRRLETDDLPRAEDLSNYKVVKSGDIVLNRMRAFQGAVGRADHDGIVSPDYLVLRPTGGVESRFMHHLMRSSVMVGEMVARLRGIGSTDTGTVRTPRINWDDLGLVPVWVPAFPRQKAIADYLDAETARIDALIAKRHRTVELLIERRASLLSDEMDHQLQEYTRVPLRHLVEIRGGLTLGGQPNSRVSRNSRRPYLRVANVQDGYLKLDEVAEIEVSIDEAGRFELRPGDVLMLEGNGNPDNLGRGTVWNGEIKGCLHQNHIHCLRADQSKIDPFYLNLAVRSPRARALLSGGSGQVSIATLSKSEIASLALPLPPLDVQRQRAKGVTERLGGIDAATQATGRQIELLREHRQALITAAVTGELRLPGAA